MNEIVIRNDEHPELRFVGQLIADTIIPVEFEDQKSRQFKLHVYAVESGGFVGSLQYDTTCEMENSILLYEEVDQFKDIENFFYVFEVQETAKDFEKLQRSERQQRASINQRIAKIYESGMFKFLDLVRLRAIQNKFGDRVAPKPEKSSLLRVLGFKK